MLTGLNKIIYGNSVALLHGTLYSTGVLPAFHPVLSAPSVSQKSICVGWGRGCYHGENVHIVPGFLPGALAISPVISH
jgi:hypothetical protein